MKSTTKISLFVLMCCVLCATAEASPVLDKASKANIGEFQYKKFKPTDGHSKKASKASSKKISSNKKRLKKNIKKIQKAKRKKTSGAKITNTARSRRGNNIIRNQYLKAGITEEQYKKFKPIDEYIKETRETKPTNNDVRNRFYLKAGIGKAEYEKFKKTKDSGYGNKKPKGDVFYNIGVGYRFTKRVRADLNLEYATSKYNHIGSYIGGDLDAKQNIKTKAAFINGYYDINLHKSIFPYITAGIGFSQNKAGDVSILDIIVKGRTQSNFVWNVGVGIQYKYNDSFALDLGYRYVDLGCIKTDDIKDKWFTVKMGEQKLKVHQLIGSLVYSF